MFFVQAAALIRTLRLKTTTFLWCQDTFLESVKADKEPAGPVSYLKAAYFSILRAFWFSCG